MATRAGLKPKSTTATTTKKRVAVKPAALGAVEHPQTQRLAQVPEQKWLDKYVNREVHGVRDFDIFDTAFERGQNVLIEGPTGPGKTSAIRAWSVHRGIHFYQFPSNGALEPSQLFGRMHITEAGSFAWQDGPVTDIWRHGGAILWGEINFTPERISSVMFPAADAARTITLLDNGAETIQAHRPNCWCDLDKDECRKKWVIIFADMNPGYEGTRPLNRALRNRFAHKLEWGYDENVEKKLVQSASLLKVAQQIRAEGSFETAVSTNLLMEFAEIYWVHGLDYALGNFVSAFDADEREAAKALVEIEKANISTELDDYFEQYRTSDAVQDREWEEGDLDPVLGEFNRDWAFGQD